MLRNYGKNYKRAAMLNEIDWRCLTTQSDLLQYLTRIRAAFFLDWHITCIRDARKQLGPLPPARFAYPHSFPLLLSTEAGR